MLRFCASSPLTEGYRLAALRRSRLLDSLPEQAFDRLTALVQRLLGVPISLVSLVDHDRQFFKSQQGLPEPVASERQTPLSHSFCQHVVASDAPLVVDDARVHPVVHDNLAIRDLGVIAYLGVPVHSPDGHPLGSLCAIDTQPRAWTDGDLAILRELAAVAESELALRAEVTARTRAEAQYRALFEASPDAVLVLEPLTETVLDANGPACALYGQPRVALVGSTMKGASADPSVGESVVAQLLAKGGTAQFESVHRRPDGGRFDVAIRASVVHIDGRSVIVSVNRDVTERKRAEVALRESEEHLRLVSRATNDAVWDWDMRTGRLVTNPAFGELFGWQDEAAAGLPSGWLVERIHPDDQARALDMFRAVMAGTESSWSSEHRFERADGTWADVLERGYILREDGTPIRTVGTMLDLSAQKATERALVEAKEAAEEVARAKGSLLSNMSHELRTPLTGILGFAEILVDEVPDDLKETVEIISRSARRLNETLSSVLDLAQLEAGDVRLTLVPADVSANVREVFSLIRPAAEEKGVELRLTGPPTLLLADRAALYRVLTNLVGNAVKFTEVGAVEVEVGADAASGWVRVSDTGIGMPDGFLSHAFDEFKQVNQGYDRSHEGNGLGLTITKRLVDLMGGTIEVESVLGRGTTFTVTLPAVVDGLGGPAARYALVPPAHQARV